MTRQYFDVSAYEIPEQSKPHRLLMMFTDDRVDENRPLVSELKAMISWMLGGMRDQLLARKELKKKHDETRFYISYGHSGSFLI